MIATHTPPALRLTLLGAALVLGASVAAHAQQPQWPWQQRPVYRQAPSTRTTTSTPVQTTRPAPSQGAQTAPSSMAAQPAPDESQRRAQTIGSSADSAQAAATCMNERKSASVETAIQSCDAVIGETLKNLANAYYFRASAKFGRSDFDGAIGD